MFKHFQVSNNKLSEDMLDLETTETEEIPHQRPIGVRWNNTRKKYKCEKWAHSVFVMRISFAFINYARKIVNEFFIRRNENLGAFLSHNRKKNNNHLTFGYTYTQIVYYGKRARSLMQIRLFRIIFSA